MERGQIQKLKSQSAMGSTRESGHAGDWGIWKGSREDGNEMGRVVRGEGNSLRKPMVRGAE